MQGLITDIKRFAVHDGDGIRTTVFLKGCSLKCVWCHNPEGISPKPQIAFYSHKCASCGRCAELCGANSFENGKHIFDFDKCVLCGKCESACFNGAFKLYGKRVTVGEVLKIALEDKLFYDSSGGGVTLSGGECLLQPDFCAELLKALKENGINTAVDTCGNVSKEAIDKVLPYTDVFLYDVKAIDEDVHIKCTGFSNKLILDNLKYIDSLGKSLEIRIPFVPQFNDNQIEKIADYLKELKGITKVRVLPYHNFAGSKYKALGMKNTLPAVLPTDKEISDAQKYFTPAL